MSSSHLHPKWWQLYLLFPLIIALFSFDFRLKLSPRGHQVVQIGILLVIYGLVHLWLRANAKALSEMDPGRYRGTIRVIRLYEAQLPEPGDDKRPAIQPPDLETEGVLSDTFEMDYIDAESFPMDEVPQEMRKE